MKRLSLVLVAVLGVASVKLFVTSSKAEARCVRCVVIACVGTPHMGGHACRFSGPSCGTVGGCGAIPVAPLPDPIPTPRPILTLAEAMDDREEDPTLRPVGACVPAPTAIATCSIPNGEASLAGCKAPWESGSRIRHVAPAERHLPAPTAGP